MFVVNIMGGLGNQLFQYNFALYLKDKFPAAEIRLNKRYFKTDSIHGGMQLGQVCFPVEQKKRDGWKRVTDSSFQLEQISDGDSVLFDGYWQDMKFFDKAYFSFSSLYGFPKDDVNISWKHRIESSDFSVSVHVRCGDYNNHYLLGNIATASYFNNAVSEILSMNNRASFFVFSDDIGWAKKNLDFRGAPACFVTGNEAPEANKYDMFLMSLCDANILSNSSFSWWAHRFNENKRKAAITPPYWINEKAASFPRTCSSLQSLSSMKAAMNVPLKSEAVREPVFSVVLTACNQEDCIRRAVSSVLNQTFESFELIVVDDCSTDSTFEVLRGYESVNDKIHAFRHDRNRSSFVARKTGCSKASGKYVLFLDGDDYLFLDALENLNAQIVSGGGFDVLEFSFAHRPSGLYEAPHAYDVSESRVEYFLRDDCHVTVWNKLYNAQFLKNVFDDLPEVYVNLGEDTLQSVCIALRTGVFMQRDILITNYVNGNGVSQKACSLLDVRRNCESIKNALSAIGQFYRENSDADTCAKIVSAAENRLFQWTLCRIGQIPSDEERAGAYCMLPAYFSEEKVRGEFLKMYGGFIKYSDGGFSLKNKMRAAYRKIRASAKRIPFVNSLYESFKRRGTMGGGYSCIVERSARS